MVLAALGDVYIERHPWKEKFHWFEPGRREILAKMTQKGIQISTYDPVTDTPSESPDGSNSR